MGGMKIFMKKKKKRTRMTPSCALSDSACSRYLCACIPVDFVGCHKLRYSCHLKCIVFSIADFCVV